jgi:hypothetical protein
MKKKLPIKKVKQTCSGFDNNKDEDCTKVAFYKCVVCDMPFCKSCYTQECGDCPNCEPPYLIKIKK